MHMSAGRSPHQAEFVQARVDVAKRCRRQAVVIIGKMSDLEGVAGHRFDAEPIERLGHRAYAVAQCLKWAPRRRVNIGMKQTT